jgi:hypothetical protein
VAAREQANEIQNGSPSKFEIYSRRPLVLLFTESVKVARKEATVGNWMNRPQHPTCIDEIRALLPSSLESKCANIVNVKIIFKGEGEGDT